MSKYGRQPDGSVKYKPVHDARLRRVKRLHYADTDTRGCWAPEKSDKGPARVQCADCGMKLTLPVHEVDDNGKVTPSIGCKNCGWHVWATLEDWSEDHE